MSGRTYRIAYFTVDWNYELVDQTLHGLKQYTDAHRDVLIRIFDCFGTDLATAKDVYLVSIDDEHMAKLLDACPWYASYTIPAGTYNGFDEDAVTVTVKATLVCRADLPDDVAYALVSTIFENTAAIAEQHAKGAELSVEFATDGIAVPFAAGAAKYYAEKGVTVETAP